MADSSRTGRAAPAHRATERLARLAAFLTERFPFAAGRVLETVSGAQLDHHLETLELLLDLGDALEGNVNPELVLEKLVNRLTPA